MGDGQWSWVITGFAGTYVTLALFAASLRGKRRRIERQAIERREL